MNELTPSLAYNQNAAVQQPGSVFDKVEPELPSHRDLPPFAALRAFDAVARLGGVRKAAKKLGRDQAVIYRHLRSIEEWTGVTLLERHPRGISLTAIGRKYHQHIVEAMGIIATATKDLVKSRDDQHLVVGCRAGFAFHWLSRHLSDFENDYPSLELDMCPVDAVTDKAKADMDVEIQFLSDYEMHPPLPSDFKSFDILSVPLIAAASPEYLEGSPVIRAPRDMLGHQFVHENNFKDWMEWLKTYGVDNFAEDDLHGPRLWQGHLTLDAARHGQGIALTNLFIAADDLQKGRLVEIGAGIKKFQPYRTGTYRFVARADRWDSFALRSFRHWLKRAIETHKPA